MPRPALGPVDTGAVPPNPSTLQVRDATVADAGSCAAIYAPYVTDTCVTFELEPPSAGELADRIATAQQEHAWLVGVLDGRVVGYAYAGSYRPRAAYRWSCETSVYLERGRAGAGLGRTLYAALLGRLGGLGYRRALAGMTLPNAASQRLHTALGFRPIGVFERVGWKHGAWRDVAWMQGDLDGVERSLGPTMATEPARIHQPA